MLCIKEVGFSSIFILVFTEKNPTKGIMIWCYQSILLCRAYCISLLFHELVLPSHLLPVLCIRHTGPSTPRSGKMCKAFLSMPAIRQSGKSLLPRLARHALFVVRAKRRGPGCSLNKQDGFGSLHWLARRADGAAGNPGCSTEKAAGPPFPALVGEG